MNVKAEFRKKYKEIRKNIDEDKREKENLKIFIKLTNLDIYKKAKTIFMYVSFGDEADTHRIMKKAFEDKKLVAVPLCNTKSHTMKCVKIDDMACLTEGAYGILEPVYPDNVIDKDNIDLVIVPGLCFTEKGERMGCGGGYYDRFLADFDGASVGLAFSDCMAESMPSEKNDRRVGMVISGGE